MADYIFKDVKRRGYTFDIVKEDGQIRKVYHMDVDAHKRHVARRVVNNPKAEMWHEFSLDMGAMHELRLLGIDPFSQEQDVMARMKRWVVEHRPDLVRRPQKFYHPAHPGKGGKR